MRIVVNSALTKSELTVLLIEHLLSPLSVEDDYILDKEKESKLRRCICGCGKDVTSHYGDTTIGISFT